MHDLPGHEPLRASAFTSRQTLKTSAMGHDTVRVFFHFFAILRLPKKRPLLFR
jgi:hypothetical protein